jgi:hypothetical protein
MGGENEQTIPKSGNGGAEAPIQTGTIRVHTSGGEVHFHDDASKLKAAVPVSLWYKVWEQLRSCQQRVWDYHDAQNGTLLSVTVTADSGPSGFPKSVSAKVELTACPADDTFKKLDAISRGVGR